MTGQDADAYEDLVACAKRSGAHLTIHCNHSASAERHPQPDWACQLLWIADHGSGPAPQSLYGTGATLPEAARSCLEPLQEDHP